MNLNNIPKQTNVWRDGYQLKLDMTTILHPTNQKYFRGGQSFRDRTCYTLPNLWIIMLNGRNYSTLSNSIPNWSSTKLYMFNKLKKRFLKACSHKNYKKAKKIYKKSFKFFKLKIDSKIWIGGREFGTFLHLAIIGKSFKMVKYLINKKGYSVYKMFFTRDERIEKNISPLSKACEIGNFKMVKYIVKKGADVIYERKAIYYACCKGYFRILHWLIERGGMILACDLYNSLHVHNDDIIVMLLLHQRIDLNDDGGIYIQLINSMNNSLINNYIDNQELFIETYSIKQKYHRKKFLKNLFLSYHKSFQKFVIFLLFINKKNSSFKKGNNPFSMISKDVLIYDIVSYLNEFSIIYHFKNL